VQSGSDWAEADAVARAVLEANGGVARIGEFIAADLTRHQIAAIFRRGVMNRPRNAWFVDPDIPWQAKHAIRVGGVADCVTAAALWGLPVPHGAQAVLHVRLQEHDTRLRHNRDKRRLVHAGDDSEVVWHRRARVTEAHYERFSALLPQRFRAALDLVDPSAESPLESLLRVAMVQHGIPRIVPQFWPHPAHRCDFLVLGLLLVEADGEEFHDPEQDAIRDAFLRGLGYRVLRFTYDEIVFHIDEVIATIMAEPADMGLFMNPGN
jgi:very-short-patch-repair endonuclease